MSVAMLPDWGQKVKATRRHKTIIEEGLDQKEMRHNVSANGLYTLKWQWACANYSESLQLREFMRSLGDARMWLPFWPDFTNLVGSFPQGVTELVVEDASLINLSAGSRAIIWQGLAGSEILSIESVEDNTLTLSEPTQQSYAEDDEFQIFPALYGRISWQPKHETDEGLVADMTFIEMVVDS